MTNGQQSHFDVSCASSDEIQFIPYGGQYQLTQLQNDHNGTKPIKNVTKKPEFQFPQLKLLFCFHTNISKKLFQNV